MQKQVVIVGLNHRSAPIDVRESVAFENSYVRDALVRLRDYPSIQEGVIKTVDYLKANLWLGDGA